MRPAHLPDRAAELAGAELGDPEERQVPISHHHVLEPTFPPADEVAAFWGSCRSVLDDAEVSAWLRSRGLDPGAIELFALARSLPIGADVPRWAQFHGRTWAEVGYRCILPMFDETGAMRSVRARRVLPNEGPDALPPAGYRIGGLVMADALGRLFLATAQSPNLWPDGEPLRIVVADGEPDYFTWATAFSDSDMTAPAVLGVVAGSWSAEIAARLPDGARVIVRTQHDEAGERYARAIFATLARRRTTLVRGGAKGCVSCAAWLRGAA